MFELRNLSKKEKAFTLIELLVTISIVSFLLAIVLFNYSSFNDKFALSSAIQELVLDIRQSQAYGINVRETSVGTSDFSKSYGIYFDPGSSPDTYYIFVDKNGDKKYNDTLGSCSGSECVQKITMRNNITVQSVSISGSNCAQTSGATSLTFIFVRPNPDANITFFNSGGNVVCSSSSVNGQVTLTTRNGLTKTVGVDPTGHIYIQ